MNELPLLLITRENPVFEAYAFYTSILILKTILMSILTAFQRFNKKVFANPEDTQLRGEGAEVKYDDPDVERVRRAHLNDLENIIPFILIGFLYVLTDPGKFISQWLFRVFTIARIVHTIVYAIHVTPQPARAICFGVGYIITIYMALAVLFYFITL